MADSDPWTEQWFKAQQQFVDAWSDMAQSGAASKPPNQSELWAQSFDLWRKASGDQAQPDVQQALNKCFDMGKEYLAMAEQVSKGLSQGSQPLDAINQWMEQLKQSLQQFGTLPGFDGRGLDPFMQQWFSPGQSWQDMVANLIPKDPSSMHMPGMNAAAFDPDGPIAAMGKILSAPSVGFFRESQEKQQRGMRLALEYQQASQLFNQAFLRVAMESIQGFQQRLQSLGADGFPGSLRELYNLWVEISEEHYAGFAMSDEYQALYGDMVNRLMVLKKHQNEMTNDFMAALNLPGSREIDTMQKRLQQLRRENIELRKELGEIKSLLHQLNAKPATKAKPAPKTANKQVVKKAARKKSPAKQSVKKAPAKTAVKKRTLAKTRKGA